MDGIIEKIKADTKKRLAEIERGRDSEVNRIQEKARREAGEIIAESTEKAEKEAVLEKERAIAAAKLQAKKEKAMLLDSLMERAISSAEERITELRDRTGYAEKLNSLANAAVEEIPSNSVTVLASKEDTEKIRIRKAKGKKVRLKASEAVKTGAIVQSANGKIKVDCTFSALLREEKSELKKELLEELR